MDANKQRLIKLVNILEEEEIKDILEKYDKKKYLINYPRLIVSGGKTKFALLEFNRAKRTYETLYTITDLKNPFLTVIPISQKEFIVTYIADTKIDLWREKSEVEYEKGERMRGISLYEVKTLAKMREPGKIHYLHGNVMYVENSGEKKTCCYTISRGENRERVCDKLPKIEISGKYYYSIHGRSIGRQEGKEVKTLESEKGKGNRFELVILRFLTPNKLREIQRFPLPNAVNYEDVEIKPYQDDKLALYIVGYISSDEDIVILQFDFAQLKYNMINGPKLDKERFKSILGMIGTDKFVYQGKQEENNETVIIENKDFHQTITIKHANYEQLSPDHFYTSDQRLVIYKKERDEYIEQQNLGFGDDDIRVVGNNMFIQEGTVIDDHDREIRISSLWILEGTKYVKVSISHPDANMDSVYPILASKEQIIRNKTFLTPLIPLTAPLVDIITKLL